MNLWLPVIVLCATMILGVFYQTHHFDKRFEDLKDNVNHRFNELDRRFDIIENRVNKFEERLERPVYRP